jgi:hypothetical protein
MGENFVGGGFAVVRVGADGTRINVPLWHGARADVFGQGMSRGGPIGSGHRGLNDGQVRARKVERSKELLIAEDWKGSCICGCQDHSGGKKDSSGKNTHNE